MRLLPVEPPAAAAGGAAAELEALKVAIGEKKKALKASGMSGKQCDKDPEVVEMVARLQELKSQVSAGGFWPCVHATPRQADPGQYSDLHFKPELYS